MKSPVFSFTPKWKEILQCRSPVGAFDIEMTMGVMRVYFPTEDIWRQHTPDWMAACYTPILSQLQHWCAENDIPLYIEESAHIHWRKYNSRLY